MKTAMPITLYALSGLLCCLPLAISAQPYPAGFFRNPLDIPMSLSGNFGELRANHYHMGIDLRTNRQVNLRVKAAAEGYISRIKVEPFGFGRALYITHPNGYTTVYAHLNRFAPKIEAWLEEEQYVRESWQVDLFPPADLFPVAKGEFIAFSGNTGGSQAPHLHFEIRRSSDEVNLNPLLFGLPCPDQVRPSILRLAVYDRTRSVYEQQPRIIPVRLSAPGAYVTQPGLVKLGSPLVSLAFTAYDTHTGSTNQNGIYKARLLVNGEEEESFVMDEISYEDTRYLNAHIDYRHRTLHSVYLQHMQELPGHLQSVYRNGGGRGVLDISDGRIIDITLEVEDTEGNRSSLRTRLQYNGGSAPPAPQAGKMFYPLMLDGYEAPECEFFIGEKCLYDSVRIRYGASPSNDTLAVSASHHIGERYVPLHEPMLVRILPGRLPADTGRVVMQWTAGGKTAVKKVQWKDGWASAWFREFGSFRLLLDTVPPRILPSGFSDGADLSKARQIAFSVTDQLGAVKNVRAELDGRWLCFSNDKGRLFVYQFDKRCPPGNHTLRISAEDEAGNRTVAEYRFKR